MPPEIAAGYIEAFVNGTLKGVWTWDELVMGIHSQKEVALAVDLCHMIEVVYPARSDGEYMNPEGWVFFLKVASLLRDRRLRPFVGLESLSVERGDIPRELRALIFNNQPTGEP